MLPVLILLVAASALANPIIRVDQVSYNDYPSNSVIEGVLDSLDNGDLTIDQLTFRETIKDIASMPDPRSQALGYGQAFAFLSSLSSGIPGDACDAAQFIDSYVNGVRDGQSVANFVNGVASHIDSVSQIAGNSNALRYSTGSRGNCKDGGRNYEFEAAWDLIFDAATPEQFNFINEQYCTAKRLRSANSVRSNNAAAVITAVSLPAVSNVFLNALSPMREFAGAVARGNAGAYANVAKQALVQAASRYQ